MNERMTESERATLCRRIDELCAENERLRQENQSIGMAAYEIGYKNGSVHYELEHCPACKNIADKNIADLQEALEENAKLRSMRDTWQENDAKLRELVRNLLRVTPADVVGVVIDANTDHPSYYKFDKAFRELGIEVSDG